MARKADDIAERARSERTDPGLSFVRARRARLKSRLSFILAAHWRKTFRQGPSDHPQLLCLVSSLGFGLKSFALFETTGAPRGHDLENLFRALSPAIQSQIASETGEPRKRFDTHLHSVRGLFKRLRNFHGVRGRLDDADVRFLRRFARAVQSGLYGHASATLKTAGEARSSRELPGEIHAPPAEKASAVRRWPSAGKHGRRVGGLGVSCSFCGQGRREARVLIAGSKVYICDECVLLCHQIIEEESARLRR